MQNKVAITIHNGTRKVWQIFRSPQSKVQEEKQPWSPINMKPGKHDRFSEVDSRKWKEETQSRSPINMKPGKKDRFSEFTEVSCWKTRKVRQIFRRGQSPVTMQKTVAITDEHETRKIWQIFRGHLSPITMRRTISITTFYETRIVWQILWCWQSTVSMKTQSW